MINKNNKKYIYILLPLIIVIIILLLYVFYNIYINNEDAIQLYKEAKNKSIKEKKRLLVLGSPTSATGKFIKLFTKTYGCGDICIDMNCCLNCENTLCDKVEDVLDKFQSNKYIIFESGLLEVVDNDKLNYIIKEMYRIAGNKENIFSNHHLQKHKWYYKNIYNPIYKYASEGNINRFVIQYPPLNNYKFENL